MKETIRKLIRRQLSAMSPTVAHTKSMAACKRLQALPEFDSATIMMIYLPIPDEVDVSPLALRGWQEEKIVTAPKLSWDKRHMVPIQIRSLETGLVESRSYLREPADGEPVSLDMLDMVVVPALAFDRKGNRLGRGGGFYDRFLATPDFAGVAVGIAFREQLLDELPVDEHDVPVDIVVTDEEVLRFTPAAGTE
ncbi:MAG: 5-formyltetrahydrofolate cyclo-ligase [Planctomycetota bacterium]